MRARLVSASMYITAFELLKDAIVERIKNFYCIGFDVLFFTLGSGFEHL